MNKEKTIKNMISYIEKMERDLQAANLAGNSKVGRSDIVNAILKELERETKDEN